MHFSAARQKKIRREREREKELSNVVWCVQGYISINKTKQKKTTTVCVAKSQFKTKL